MADLEYLVALTERMNADKEQMKATMDTNHRKMEFATSTVSVTGPRRNVWTHKRVTVKESLHVHVD
jgi:hypothetical protein